MFTNSFGALCFGLVIGWVTYRTLRRTSKSGLSDIASVFGAIGGAAVTKLFPADSGSFPSYCVGLAIGFFLYLLTAMIVASASGKGATVNEWLGTEPQVGNNNQQSLGRLEDVARR